MRGPHVASVWLLISLESTKAAKSTEAKDSKPNSSKKKLSYKESRELESLPKLIETLELELETAQELVNDPEFFKQDPEETKKALNQLAEIESKLDIAFERWTELEEKQKN